MSATALQQTDKKEVGEVKEPKTLKDWISGDSFKESLRYALPTHMKPERFVRVALTQLMKTPKLGECTQESVIKAMLDLSSLGLEPDGRLAHLIPFRNNKKNIMEVQLIIDYKGLIQLAKRSGEVAMWRAEIVCESDDFSWTNGIVDHKVNWLKPRGKVLAVYSHVKNKDGVDEYEVLTLEDVQHARKKSRAANDGPWVTDFNEMAKKTAIRRHSKKLTLSPEFHDALIKEDDRDEEIELDESQYESMMPKALDEKIESPVNDQKIAERVEMKPIGKDDFAAAVNSAAPKKHADCELPDFESPAQSVAPDKKITADQVQDLQSALVKYKRQATAFYEFLETCFGVKDMRAIFQKDFDQVMVWITKD